MSSPARKKAKTDATDHSSPKRIYIKDLKKEYDHPYYTPVYKDAFIEGSVINRHDIDRTNKPVSLVFDICDDPLSKASTIRIVTNNQYAEQCDSLKLSDVVKIFNFVMIKTPKCDQHVSSHKCIVHVLKSNNARITIQPRKNNYTSPDSFNRSKLMNVKVSTSKKRVVDNENKTSTEDSESSSTTSRTKKVQRNLSSFFNRPAELPSSPSILVQTEEMDDSSDDSQSSTTVTKPKCEGKNMQMTLRSRSKNPPSSILTGKRKNMQRVLRSNSNAAPSSSILVTSSKEGQMDNSSDSLEIDSQSPPKATRTTPRRKVKKRQMTLHFSSNAAPPSSPRILTKPTTKTEMTLRSSSITASPSSPSILMNHKEGQMDISSDSLTDSQLTPDKTQTEPKKEKEKMLMILRACFNPAPRSSTSTQVARNKEGWISDSLVIDFQTPSNATQVTRNKEDQMDDLSDSLVIDSQSPSDATQVTRSKEGQMDGLSDSLVIDSESSSDATQNTTRRMNPEYDSFDMMVDNLATPPSQTPELTSNSEEQTNHESALVKSPDLLLDSQHSKKNQTRDYVQLKDIKKDTIVNVYGVVKFYRAPSKTRGLDYHMLLVLVDPSLDNGQKIVCNLFNRDDAKLPVVKSVGDIVRFHRLKIYEYGSSLQCATTPGFSWLVFQSKINASLYPVSVNATYTFDEQDKETVKGLRNWIATVGIEDEDVPTHIPLRSSPGKGQGKGRTLSQIGLSGEYFDLTCQIISKVVIEQNRCLGFRIWDGTKLKHESRKIELDTSKSYKIHLHEGLLKKAGRLGLIADVCVFDNHFDKASKCQVGEIIQLTNLHALRCKDIGTADSPIIELVLHKGSSFGRGIVLENSDEAREKIEAAFKETLGTGTDMLSDSIEQEFDASFACSQSSQQQASNKIYSQSSSSTYYTPTNSPTKAARANDISMEIETDASPLLEERVISPSKHQIRIEEQKEEARLSRLSAMASETNSSRLLEDTEEEDGILPEKVSSSEDITTGLQNEDDEQGSELDKEDTLPFTVHCLDQDDPDRDSSSESSSEVDKQPPVMVHDVENASSSQMFSVCNGTQPFVPVFDDHATASQGFLTSIQGSPNTSGGSESLFDTPDSSTGFRSRHISRSPNRKENIHAVNISGGSGKRSTPVVIATSESNEKIDMPAMNLRSRKISGCPRKENVCSGRSGKKPSIIIDTNNSSEKEDYMSTMNLRSRQISGSPKRKGNTYTWKIHIPGNSGKNSASPVVINTSDSSGKLDSIPVKPSGMNLRNRRISGSPSTKKGPQYIIKRKLISNLNDITSVEDYVSDTSSGEDNNGDIIVPSQYSRMKARSLSRRERHLRKESMSKINTVTSRDDNEKCLPSSNTTPKKNHSMNRNSLANYQDAFNHYLFSQDSQSQVEDTTASDVSPDRREMVETATVVLSGTQLKLSTADEILNGTVPNVFKTLVYCSDTVPSKATSPRDIIRLQCPECFYMCPLTKADLTKSADKKSHQCPNCTDNANLVYIYKMTMVLVDSTGQIAVGLSGAEAEKFFFGTSAEDMIHHPHKFNDVKDFLDKIYKNEEDKQWMECCIKASSTSLCDVQYSIINTTLV